MLVKVAQNVLEHFVLDFARFAVQHHHAAFIAVGRGIFGDFLLGEFEFKL